MPKGVKFIGFEEKSKDSTPQTGRVHLQTCDPATGIDPFLGSKMLCVFEYSEFLLKPLKWEPE